MSLSRKVEKPRRAVAKMQNALGMKLNPPNPHVKITYQPDAEASLHDHIFILKTIAQAESDKLGNTQAVIEAPQQAFELRPSDLDCVDWILYLMVQHRWHTQYFEFVERLDQQQHGTSRHGQMTELLFSNTNHYNYLGLVASCLGRVEIAASILQKAVDAALQLSDPKLGRLQRIAYGELLRRHDVSRFYEALVMWMNVINEYGEGETIAKDQDEAVAKDKLIML